MLKSENTLLETKKREWDSALREFYSWFRRAWKEIKFDMKNAFDWYLFYQPRSNADKVWHFIQMALVDIILLKLFGLI